MAGPDPAGRNDSLRQALNEYLAIPGMEAALLVSDQGLIISSAAHRGVDAAEIAALVIDTVASAQRFGLQVEAGYLDTMSIEFQRLTVVLAPFTQDVMLALVAVPGSLSTLQGSLGRGRDPQSPESGTITSAKVATAGVEAGESGGASSAAGEAGRRQSGTGEGGTGEDGGTSVGENDGLPSAPPRGGA